MALNLVCPCGKRLRINDSLAGKRIKCPQCGHVQLAPSTGKPEVSAPTDTSTEERARATTGPSANGQRTPPAVQRQRAAAPPTPRPKRARWLWVAGGAGGAALLLIAALVIFRPPNGETTNPGPNLPGTGPNGAGSNLPGASGQPVVELQMPPSSIPLLRYFLARDSMSRPKPGESFPQTFPAGTKQVWVGVALAHQPPQGTKLTLRVLGKDGPMSMPQGFTVITITSATEFIWMLPCRPVEGAIPDGPYQTEVHINNTKCALLNWSIGGTVPSPADVAAETNEGLPREGAGDPKLTYALVSQNPGAFRGKRVVWPALGSTGDGKRLLCAVNYREVKDPRLYQMYAVDFPSQSEFMKVLRASAGLQGGGTITGTVAGKVEVSWEATANLGGAGAPAGGKIAERKTATVPLLLFPRFEPAQGNGKLTEIGKGGPGMPKATPAEHPLKDVSVGEWVEYKVMPQDDLVRLTFVHRNTVIKKTAEEVVLETWFVGFTSKDKAKTKATTTFKLTEPYNPLAALSHISLTIPGKTSYKKLEAGSEILKLAGKTFNTTWTLYEISGKTKFPGVEGNLPSPQRLKVWFSSQVPAGGVVKTEYLGRQRVLAEYQSTGKASPADLTKGNGPQGSEEANKNTPKLADFAGQWQSEKTGGRFDSLSLSVKSDGTGTYGYLEGNRFTSGVLSIKRPKDRWVLEVTSATKMQGKWQLIMALDGQKLVLEKELELADEKAITLARKENKKKAAAESKKADQEEKPAGRGEDKEYPILGAMKFVKLPRGTFWMGGGCNDPPSNQVQINSSHAFDSPISLDISPDDRLAATSGIVLWRLPEK